MGQAEHFVTRPVWVNYVPEKDAVGVWEVCQMHFALLMK